VRERHCCTEVPHHNIAILSARYSQRQGRRRSALYLHSFTPPPFCGSILGVGGLVWLNPDVVSELDVCLQDARKRGETSPRCCIRGVSIPFFRFLHNGFAQSRLWKE